MELTTLTSASDKKINLKKSPSSISSSNNKIANFMITSRSPSPIDGNNVLNNPKPNQVGVFMRKNCLVNSDKKKDVSVIKILIF